MLVQPEGVTNAVVGEATIPSSRQGKACQWLWVYFSSHWNWRWQRERFKGRRNTLALGFRYADDCEWFVSEGRKEGRKESRSGAGFSSISSSSALMLNWGFANRPRPRRWAHQRLSKLVLRERSGEQSSGAVQGEDATQAERLPRKGDGGFIVRDGGTADMGTGE